MAEQPSGFDIVAIAMSTVVIVGMLFLAIHLIPLLARVLYQLLPLVIVVWFVVMVLRGIVRGLWP